MTAFILKTTIAPGYVLRALKRGSLIAGVGVAALFFVYLTLSPELLSLVGIWVYLASSVLIAVGLIPYLKLRRLEIRPYILEVDEMALRFIVNGKIVHAVSRKNIEALSFIETKKWYGICVRLHEGQKELFLPYFSRRSFERLRDHL